MGKIINKIPDLMRERGWSPADLVKMGLPQNTVYRAVRGELNFTLDVIGRMCDVMKVGITDLFEYQEDDKKPGEDNASSPGDPQ